MVTAKYESRSEVVIIDLAMCIGGVDEQRREIRPVDGSKASVEGSGNFT
jgi:hypothetical protein